MVPVVLIYQKIDQVDVVQVGDLSLLVFGSLVGTGIIDRVIEKNVSI